VNGSAEGFDILPGMGNVTWCGPNVSGCTTLEPWRQMIIRGRQHIGIGEAGADLGIGVA
jgi:hypothetical protein